MSLSRRSTRCVWALLGVPTVLGAQSPIKGLVRDAVYQREFSSVAGVRELSDGTLLVGDRLERELVLLEGPSSTGRALLRKGFGPNEIQTISGLVAGRADSTLIYDSVQRRVLLLVGTHVHQSTARGDMRWHETFTFPLAIDRAGVVYGLRAKESTLRRGPISAGKLSPFSADSVELMAWSPQKARTHAVLTARGAFTPSNMVVKTIAGATSYYQLTSLLDFPDALAVCGDGRALQVSPAYGTVHWWFGGKPSAVKVPLAQRVPVSAAEKRRAIEASQGIENAQFFSPDEYPTWPRYMPVFERDGAWCLDSGDALIEGTADANGVRRYLLIPKSGVARVVTGAPPNARIVGVGKGRVYFGLATGDGLFQVARLRLTE